MEPASSSRSRSSLRRLSGWSRMWLRATSAYSRSGLEAGAGPSGWSGAEPLGAASTPAVTANSAISRTSCVGWIDGIRRPGPQGPGCRGARRGHGGYGAERAEISGRGLALVAVERRSTTREVGRRPRAAGEGGRTSEDGLVGGVGPGQVGRKGGELEPRPAQREGPRPRARALYRRATARSGAAGRAPGGG